MDREKLLQRLIMILFIFIITQLSMLLILNQNIIPLQTEWASVCKEWIKSVVANYYRFSIFAEL